MRMEFTTPRDKGSKDLCMDVQQFPLQAETYKNTGLQVRSE